MTKSTLKLAFFALILVGLAAAISACVKKPAVQPVNQNQNTSATTSTSEIDTSDWKTYRNEEYGFEFRYPEDSTITLRNDNKDIYVNVGSAKANIIIIQLKADNVQASTINEWLSEQPWQPGWQTLHVGDIELSTREIPIASKYQSMSLLYFLKNGKVFQIEWYGGEGNPLVDEYRLFVTVLNTLDSIST